MTLWVLTWLISLPRMPPSLFHQAVIFILLDIYNTKHAGTMAQSESNISPGFNKISPEQMWSSVRSFLESGRLIDVCLYQPRQVPQGCPSQGSRPTPTLFWWLCEGWGQAHSGEMTFQPYPMQFLPTNLKFIKYNEFIFKKYTVFTRTIYNSRF